VSDDIIATVRAKYAGRAKEIAQLRTVSVGSLGLSCSLSDDELAVRKTEWAACDTQLVGRNERAGFVEMTYHASPVMRETLERLVAAERSCCADARWSLHDEGTILRVTVEAQAAGDACCDTDCGDAYSAEDLASIGIDARASLGCGNPTLLADLRPGETVLDLGSGAGLDVLLSARRVSPGGHAYGVDMTDEMLAVARANQDRSGVKNATFLKGTIEAIPLPDTAVDVIISNCVINLAADKGAVLREAFRMLRPGGRLAVADMVALEELAPGVKQRLDLWAGCVAGTISIEAYTSALSAAGFAGIDIEVTREVRLDGVEGRIASAHIRARKPALVATAAR